MNLIERVLTLLSEASNFNTKQEEVLAKFLDKWSLTWSYEKEYEGNRFLVGAMYYVYDVGNAFELTDLKGTLIMRADYDPKSMASNPAKQIVKKLYSLYRK